MINITNVFPECYADTLLVELIMDRKYPHHCKGVPKVNHELKERKDANGVLIAVVDTDRDKYVEEYKHLVLFEEKVNKRNEDEGLALKKLPNKEHYVIFVHTKFETWIWKQADLAGINKVDFDLRSIEDLYSVSKHYNTNADSPTGRNFKRFVNAVVQAAPPGVTLLKKWLVDNDFT